MREERAQDDRCALARRHRAASAKTPANANPTNGAVLGSGVTTSTRTQSVWQVVLTDGSVTLLAAPPLGVTDAVTLLNVIVSVCTTPIVLSTDGSPEVTSNFVNAPLLPVAEKATS